ncbi:MAG: ExbD/TolR family protein [Myxococcota bacterium]
MKLSKQAHNKNLSEMNLTPLVDVVMVLMIIFMVTAPLEPEGIDLDLPDADAATIPKDDGKLTIYMELDKTITITAGEKELLTTELKSLKNVLHNKFSNKKEANIKADKELKYEEIMKLLVEVRKGGITKLGLLVNKKKKKEKTE